MVSYKELGLVNTREMFKRAVAGGYAIPAFNFNTMEQMQAIVQAAEPFTMLCQGRVGWLLKCFSMAVTMRPKPTSGCQRDGSPSIRSTISARAQTIKGAKNDTESP